MQQSVQQNKKITSKLIAFVECKHIIPMYPTAWMDDRAHFMYTAASTALYNFCGPYYFIIACLRAQFGGIV